MVFRITSVIVLSERVNIYSKISVTLQPTSSFQTFLIFFLFLQRYFSFILSLNIGLLRVPDLSMFLPSHPLSYIFHSLSESWPSCDESSTVLSPANESQIKFPLNSSIQWPVDVILTSYQKLNIWSPSLPKLLSHPGQPIARSRNFWENPQQ